MGTTLPISRLINVSVDLDPPGAQAPSLNTLLMLGSSPVIDVVQREREYSSLAEVALDFSNSDPEYLAAVLFFEQVPQPATLYIGRWAQTATPGQLYGGPLSATQQAIAVWQAVTTGGFYVVIDGVAHAVTGINLSAAANLNAVAADIQAQLPASVLCTWNANYERFLIQSSTTGAASSISFLKIPTGVGTATFSGNPANDDTLTLNGTAITFVTSGATGLEVNIGISLAATLASLLTLLQGSSDTQLVKFSYIVSGDVLSFTAVAPGAGGDSLTLAKSSTAITLSAGTLTGGNATDISAMLIMQNTAGNGAYIANGVAAESALTAVELFDTMFGQQWFALVVLGAVDADHEAIAPFIEASNNAHYYGVTTQEGGVITPGDTSDIAYILQQAGYTRTCVNYSSTNPYGVVSMLARIITVAYAGQSTVITLMYKQEPGVVPENLNETQIDALEAKDCNVYVQYNNNTAIIERGVSCSGDFIDTVIGILGLAINVQTALYNALYTTPTKIPQTDPGMAILLNAAIGVLQANVTNGLLAPGQWNSSAVFGSLVQGAQIPGYYAYTAPVSQQAEPARAARIGSPIQIAVKLAGAVQTVNAMITVNS